MSKTKKQQTTIIEGMLKDGRSLSPIAKLTGLSRQRVYQIKKRMGKESLARLSTTKPDVPS